MNLQGDTFTISVEFFLLVIGVAHIELLLVEINRAKVEQGQEIRKPDALVLMKPF